MKKIDLTWHKEFFRGVYAPWQRMSPALLDFYHEPEAWRIRSRCASSVQIIMQTDAETVEFSWQYGTTAREIYTTDVRIGLQWYFFDKDDRKTLKLAPGKKEIVIYLPHLLVVEDFTVKVNDEATVEPVIDQRPKLLICGDSIWQGMTCSRPALASVVQAADALDMQVHNTSVGGAIMQPVPVRETLKFGGAGDVAIVGFGINDASSQTPLEVFRERTRQTLEYLNDFAGRSFIITPIPCTVPAEERRESYSQVILDELKDFPAVNLIDGPSFFTASEEFLIDGVHPNDRGMKVYADALVQAIKGNC